MNRPQEHRSILDSTREGLSALPAWARRLPRELTDPREIAAARLEAEIQAQREQPDLTEHAEELREE
jgi:hypothetical protein